MKKISIQKIFCFISMLFILSCCIFYGTRFIKLYLENKEVEKVEKNSLVKVIKENNDNNKNFKVINGETYFTNKENSNYLLYSNILWRIIKIQGDNSIVLISDSSVTTLAYGKELTNETSYINKWLNLSDEEYSGILEKSLNKKEHYLQNTIYCNDTVEKLTNNPCEDIKNDKYISLLSVIDYLNIGSKDSYLINDEYFYLGNTNEKKKIWYVTEDGNTSLSTGNDIIGVRPVITIKANIDYVKGNGTKDNPYTIEKDYGLFGSYVKLDDNLWRIYQVNDTEVRLMLNDYLKVNKKNLEYNYSVINSYYNDTKANSIAYYLNKTFLNTLSFKDKIKEVSWSNGYYNQDTLFDYKYALKDKINTKVALMSIGDIYLNSKLTNYFTMTGSSNRGSMVFSIQNNQKPYAKYITQTINVVPTISLDKDLLTKGNGTYDSPYEME